ncbi:phosphotransferase family protein [Hydrogenophaga sp.]|uniref:phosphotransferase family protein n=1 Tax=Hydrogenophaga sp. TaxID=1904254 RepID=UPI0026292A9B|nr:phosphotransferase family protein [Hydrogenophaga sp.]MCW5653900.1 phosphotransferase family protein [Hydrogenophaga sp.]
MHPKLHPWQVSDENRDHPDPAFIERMRQQFPTEREVDLMLTRKMQRRASPPFDGVSFEAMSGYIAALLKDRVEGPFSIMDQRWFSGGASKIQMGFTLHWDEPGVGPTQTKLVARMEPAESLNATSRAREFELLEAFQGVLPVPKVYWVDPDGTWFPEPALIYAFAEGVTKPRSLQGKVAGIGTNFGPELRRRLLPDFVAHLARIHTFDPQSRPFVAFDRPSVGTTQSALWQLNRARRIWEEDRGEELPLMEVAANWLERRMPKLDRLSVVHGDYRSGNFLFDEDSARITAVLDWERGYLGDRHRDLAWTTAEQYGHWSEDGKTFLASGIAPVNELLERYEAASGLRVDPATLDYYRVFNCYQIVVTALASSYRVVHLGKTHQDVLIAWIEGAAYGSMEELRQAMERSL